MSLYMYVLIHVPKPVKSIREGFYLLLITMSQAPRRTSGTHTTAWSDTFMQDD